MLQKVEIFLLGYISHIRNSGRNSLSCVKAAEVNVAGIRICFSWIVSVSQLWSRLSLLRQCESCRNQKDLYMDRICFATLVSTLFVASMSMSMSMLQESEGEDCGGCEAGSQEGCAPSENLIMMMIKMVMMVKMMVKMMMKVIKRAPKRDIRQVRTQENYFQEKH